MKIFKDAEMTTEVANLDFGTVDAGTTKQFTFFAYNEQKCEVQNLQFIFANKELTLVSAPSTLKELEKAELIVEWSPSITLKQGLKTFLEMKFYEVWK